MYTIGDKIAELRKNKKMSQDELASVVGVSARSVYRWENSQTMPDNIDRLLPMDYNNGRKTDLSVRSR